jgi:hypothetical protein
VQVYVDDRSVCKPAQALALTLGLAHNGPALIEGAALPDGAFPLQVVIPLGSQRVLAVISERTE